MNRVLLVDDERNLRESLRDYLQEEGLEVSEASCLGEAREQITQLPDVVLLDRRLPDGDGFELLRSWRKKGNQTPVILLTARGELIDKIMGLEMGANDYLTKPFEPRELLARVRVQLRDPHPTPTEKLEAAGIELNLRTRDACYAGQTVELKKMEYALLKQFLESPDRVFSRDELLNQVWGYDRFPTTRTIDTHILQLRQKFAPHLFETVRGVGYRLRENPSLPKS